MSLADQRGDEARKHDNIVRQIGLLDQERLRLEGRVKLLDELIAGQEPEPVAPESNGHAPESLRARVGRALRS